jgi:FkbM family methyltransferase
MKEATDALRQVNVFKLEKEPRKKQIASAEVTSMFPLHLPDRTVNLPFRTRGPVDRSIVAHIWERDTYGVRSISNPPSTVVDIGAHIGAFSVMAAEAWPEARVIACEADPENYLMLRENLCGRHNIETVKAAIIGQDLNEVEFNAVIDKSAYNSGGGTCVRDEPWTTKTRVPAMSVVRLWSTKGIRQCDLLKLDCEGAEVQILQVLADSRLLADVQLIVGEWHAEDDRESTRNRVKEELHTILQPTHSVAFSPNGRGKEGYFTARIRAESPTNRPPTFAKQ